MRTIVQAWHWPTIVRASIIASFSQETDITMFTTSFRKLGPTTIAILLGILLSGVSLCVSAQESAAVTANPQAIIRTSMGDITVELLAEKAPVSVENFIRYAESGFYDGTIFHRVISHFMIQGGGFSEDMTKKPTGEPIVNESDNGLSNARGTLAMARTGDPHSATAQFFINVQDNFNLDHKGGMGTTGWGYAVFARVNDGMKVVDDIRFVETSNRSPFSDVPRITVSITSIEIVHPQ